MPEPATARLLLVLRHAQAEKGVPGPDRDRPLTAAGLAALLKTAAAARHKGVRPDLILCSPARRARDTAEAFRQETAPGCALQFDAELYHGDANAMLQLVRNAPVACRQLLVVGHNPTLEDLLHRLAGPHRAGGEFRPGALAVLRCRAGTGWRELAADTATLEYQLWHQP